MHCIDFKKQFIVCSRTKARQQFSLFQMCSDLEATNSTSLELAKFTFQLIIYFSTTEIRSYSLCRKTALTRLSKREEN